MNLIDRLLIGSYLKSFLLCLAGLLSLYVVVDLFTNVDGFTDRDQGVGRVMTNIAYYYFFHAFEYYDRIGEAIVLIAAAFTLAWIQRNNELLPLLSAGISTRRVVLPLLACAAGLLIVNVINREMVIPRIGMRLTYARNDPSGEQAVGAQAAYEPNGIHLHGTHSTVTGRHNIVTNMSVTLPPGFGVHLHAREARYIPADPHADGPTGGWLLIDATPPQLEEYPDALVLIDPGKYFLHTQQVDFETLRRPRDWYRYASVVRLREELSKPDSARLAAMAVLFHSRLTRPLLGMVLVLAGVSIILRDQNRSPFLSAGLCLTLCGTFFAVQFFCNFLGDREYLAPALAAWLPILLFGPFAFVLFDAVHT